MGGNHSGRLGSEPVAARVSGLKALQLPAGGSSGGARSCALRQRRAGFSPASPAHLHLTPLPTSSRSASVGAPKRAQRRRDDRPGEQAAFQRSAASPSPRQEWRSP
jgi:hypothetical protein